LATETLRVIARLKARPEKTAELREVLYGLLEPTRRKAGCIRYEMLENQEDPTEFTFTEEWTDASGLATHFETEHIRNALERFPDLLTEELDLRRYRLVG
jgi:quinol monooxygenase YgiN